MKLLVLLVAVVSGCINPRNDLCTTSDLFGIPCCANILQQPTCSYPAHPEGFKTSGVCHRTPLINTPDAWTYQCCVPPSPPPPPPPPHSSGDGGAAVAVPHSSMPTMIIILVAVLVVGIVGTSIVVAVVCLMKQGRNNSTRELTPSLAEPMVVQMPPVSGGAAPVATAVNIPVSGGAAPVATAVNIPAVGAPPTGARFDPNTGAPIPKFNPNTGEQNW